MKTARSNWQRRRNEVSCVGQRDLFSKIDLEFSDMGKHVDIDWDNADEELDADVVREDDESL